MNAAAELGRNPVSKHQVQIEYGDRQERDRGCQTKWRTVGAVEVASVSKTPLAVLIGLIGP